MAKAKECTIIFNTRNGYCLQPQKFKSINQAIKEAKANKLAFRLFVNGLLVKSGWYI